MQKTNRPEFLISALLASLLIGFATSAACAQESGSATAVGPGPPQVLQGEIRWKKALGTVPIVAGLSAAHSDPCSAFSVVVVTPTDEQEFIALIDKLTWKIRDGEFNICEFKISLPSNIPYRVYAEVGKKDASEAQTYLYLHGGWSGGEKIPYDS